MFISYAQNYEDVVLWRALRDVRQGTYVDVGAADPIVDSVTCAFHRAGWTGVNVEPVPRLAEAHRRERPDDTTFACAAGPMRGTATLFAATHGGTSTLHHSDDPLAERLNVPVVSLDELLLEAGLSGETIHFCTIDVEGAEADVLQGFDLERWRPWLLLIEATAPNSMRQTHATWESLVVDRGYSFCLFDGLNRFYVADERADELGDRLSYPACVFDQPFERADQATVRVNLTRMETETALLDEANEHLQARLAAVQETLSWRLTRPLRAVRRIQRGRGAQASRPSHRDAVSPEDLAAAFARRISVVTEMLAPQCASTVALSVDEALTTLTEVIAAGTATSQHGRAWLSLVAVTGTYPAETDVTEIARMLRMNGSAAVRCELERRFAQALRDGTADTATLRVVEERTIVDVTHTIASSFQTGIQRVVRETVGCWIEGGRDLLVVRFDLRASRLQETSAAEVADIRDWRAALGRRTNDVYGPPGDVIVPWRCHLVIPELCADARRCDAYRGLAASEILGSLSMIGYDLIPVVAPETVAEGMPGQFVDYLSVVKRADRVSAISRTSARAFTALTAAAADQGLRAPAVEAHELPTEAPRLDPSQIEASRRWFGVSDLPIVLVVGSHEPRKNHVRILEAAERLWRSGAEFQVLAIGGRSWRTEAFDRLLTELGAYNRPVSVVRECRENDLWAAYHLARFTVFPSLLEGYGLPIAESLAVGTPVITSRHGSMAEVAEPGGCLLVDPYNVTEITDAMRRLLEDDDLLTSLQREASQRRMPTWREYADGVWDFLVEQAGGP